MKGIELSGSSREVIVQGQVTTEIRIPFWTRIRMLFCPWVRMTVPVKLVPTPGPAYNRVDPVYIHVEERAPIKLSAEVVVPQDRFIYTRDGGFNEFVMNRLVEQFIKGIRRFIKIETYSDPIQNANVIRADLWVLDKRL